MRRYGYRGVRFATDNEKARYKAKYVGALENHIANVANAMRYLGEAKEAFNQAKIYLARGEYLLAGMREEAGIKLLYKANPFVQAPMTNIVGTWIKRLASED